MSKSKNLHDKALASLAPPFNVHDPLSQARVVEWQTRTFEGRMPKGMRVQVPPRALLYCQGAPASREMMAS